MEPTHTLAKVVIPFVPDTTAIDAALDRIEQRVESIVAKFASITITESKSAKGLDTEQKPSVLSTMVDKVEGSSTQDDLLEDLKDVLEGIANSVLNIEESVQGVNKPG